MGRDRAAYMRQYRAALKLTKDPGVTLVADEHFALLNARIAELEEEVRHLKAELAKRPSEAEPFELPQAAKDLAQASPYPEFNSRPFTPVPKHK